MKLAASIALILTLLGFAIPGQASAATDPDICEIRAAILGSVAQERDKGVPKAQVKRIFERKFGKRFAGFSGYVDLVYDQMKGMSPTEVAKFTKLACSME